MPHPVDLRILQANERTLLAWVRTGLALMAFGFVVARLAFWLRLEPGTGGRSASLMLGSSIIALGAACQILGAGRFAKARRELLEGRTHVPDARGPIALAAIVAALGAGLIAYVLAS